MRKLIINREVYLNYYNIGLSDVKIAMLMGISNTVLSKFRKSLNLVPNRPKFTVWKYSDIDVTFDFNQVILGSVIGDGSLELNSKCKAKNARLRFGHCIKQLDYLQYKVSMLPKLWKSKIRVLESKAEISSISHPILTYYYNKFYNNGTKILPTDLISDIEPLALSILFMDDGSYDKNTNSIYISLCNFTKLENETFIQMLKDKFNIDASLMKKGKIGKKYFHIYIKASSRDNFRNLVRPYLIPSMLYKIGE